MVFIRSCPRSYGKTWNRESTYSLETVREGAVCLIPSEHGFLVTGGGGDGVGTGRFLPWSREFFRRIFQDDEMAETVMQEFLTRTLDLPAIMKGPSITGLEARIFKCREEMAALEQKALKPDGQKWKINANLTVFTWRGF